MRVLTPTSSRRPPRASVLGALAATLTLVATVGIVGDSVGHGGSASAQGETQLNWVSGPDIHYDISSALRGQHRGGARAAVDRPKPFAAPADPSAPRRVVVPALHIDAGVVPVGASGGELLPPSDVDLLGWWADGAKPGDPVGSALITGHSVHTGGGALEHIDELVAGDAMSVEVGHRTVSYVVSEVEVLSKPDLAREAASLFAQNVPGRVVLITCADWNGSEWLSNAVVTAVRAPVAS